MIEVLNKKLYITGDSLLTKELAENIGETDAIICNLVEEGYLKALIGADESAQDILNYLLKLRTEAMTKMIIGIHLIDFKWTVDERYMRKIVEEHDLFDIIIPISSDEKIIIK